MALTSSDLVHCDNLRRQIKQVLLTYFTHRVWWWLGGLACLASIPWLMVLFSSGHSHRPNDFNGAYLIIGIPQFTLLMFLVGQAKTQFAHSRARLVPGFMPAHLLALGAILVATYWLFPLLLTRSLGVSLLGLMAFSLAMGAPALWGAQLNRFSLSFVSLAVSYTIFAEWGQRFWIVDAPIYRNVHLAIVLMGIVAVSAWLWRLSHLTEEDEDYLNVMHPMLARRTGSEAVEQRRVVATMVRRNWLMSHVSDWWYGRIKGYYGGSPSDLARLLRYGSSAVPAEVNGLFFVLMAVCMVIVFKQFDFFPQNAATFGSAFFLIQFGVLMPATIAGEQMAQRRPRIANELLLPLSRTQLIDGLFAVSIRTSAMLWLMMHVTLGLALAITDQPVTLRKAVVFVILSATTMLAAMGMSLRFSVWPSQGKRLCVMIISLLALLPPLFACAATQDPAYDLVFIALAAVLAAVGLWGLKSARWAWLELEFV